MLSGISRMKPEQKIEIVKNKNKRLALAGILFGTALVLGFVENSMPPLPFVVPGVRLGMSNIIVMYDLLFLGTRFAHGIAFLKGTFVFVTRGLVAGLLSLSGGLLSISVMLLVLLLTREEPSYLRVSISGAIAHNLGQMLVVGFLYVGMYIWYYFPVLIVAGLIAGTITATLLKVFVPAIQRLV